MRWAALYIGFVGTFLLWWSGRDYGSDDLWEECSDLQGHLGAPFGPGSTRFAPEAAYGVSALTGNDPSRGGAA